MVFFPGQSSPNQPQSPPPTFIPPNPYSTYLVDCYYQNTYVTLINGDSFWFYPISVESGAVTGYRWTGLFWTFYGFDPRLIDEVACYPTPTLY